MTYTEVLGRSRQTAEALLEAARRIGQDPRSVRTTIRGYVVSDAIAEYYEKMRSGGTQPIEVEEVQPVEAEQVEPEVEVEVEEHPVPDETWKVVDLRAFARENSIPIAAEITKKADILAAIRAAGTEEE